MGVLFSVVDGEELCQKLEIVACDAAVSNFRPCEVALVTICAQMDANISRLECQPNRDNVLAIVNFTNQLQQFCKV